MPQPSWLAGSSPISPDQMLFLDQGALSRAALWSQIVLNL